MPAMSSTEKEALASGNVGFEQQLFNGSPDLAIWLEPSVIKWTPKEQHFLDTQVNQLCQLLDDWDITHQRMDLSPEVWEFIRTQGFMGLMIPEEYGGSAFSVSALVEVLVRLSGKSVTGATTVGVVNSLGPAELLLHYGTDDQKKHYLPRLACGDEIPCFALTNPDAGSDAASVPDRGIVCRREFKGEVITGILLNWDKRYITLCPIATLMGLAFHLLDPEHLVGDKEDVGMTCALIPSDTPGIIKGRRHRPVGTAFMNGPTQGKEVFIPLDWIIGGVEMAGHGWQMLMECLSAGRAICLPSGALGGALAAALAASSYARVRQQFGLPIAQFEGIEAAVAKAMGYTYIIQAALRVTAANRDLHDVRSSVISAILKCYTTEWARKILNEAMDIHGGKAICIGPKNYLASGFEALPIGITVEGANILTRYFIIYGQGAMRCHPFLMEEMESAWADDLPRFRHALWGHVKLVTKHVWRVVFGTHKKNKDIYQKAIYHYSAMLAFLSDIAMVFFGSQLKRKERISARLADMLSFLYCLSCVLKYHQEEGDDEQRAQTSVLKDWACQTLLYDIEEAAWDLLHNLSSHRSVVWFFRSLLFPRGRRCEKPLDHLEHGVAQWATHDSKERDYFFQSVFKESLVNNPLGQLDHVFKQILATEELEHKVMQAAKKREIQGFTRSEKIEAARQKGIITSAEADKLNEVEILRQAVLAVDDFSP